VTKVASVSARFSKSLARRRFRPNQEKVRSTTQRHEALHVVAPLDDRQAQPRHLCHGCVNLPGVVAAIGPDQFEPREASAYLVEHQTGPVAVLDRGGMDDDPHRQPFAVVWILWPLTCLPAS
jgi:hypothetical protein